MSRRVSLGALRASLDGAQAPPPEEVAPSAAVRAGFARAARRIQDKHDLQAAVAARLRADREARG